MNARQSDSVSRDCVQSEVHGQPAEFTPRLKTAGLLKAASDFGYAAVEAMGSLFYVCRGLQPFGKGYRHYRDRYISQIIRDDQRLQSFAASRGLPDNFGVRIDERVVEYPWLLSRIDRLPLGSRFLDAGSTLNHRMILEHPAFRRNKWSILTLAPESQCFWNLGISYLYEDLRALPFKDGWFDGAACVSVIEHVGMDNAIYSSQSSHRESRPQEYLLAIQELRRVIKSGGFLWLTVPFGQRENHGWLQQFDSGMLSDLISEFRPQNVQKTFFRYAKQGWQITTERACSDASYFDVRRISEPTDKQVVRADSELPVAAMAVACLELQK